MKCKHVQTTPNTTKPVVKEPVKCATQEIKTATFQEMIANSKKEKN